MDPNTGMTLALLDRRRVKEHSRAGRHQRGIGSSGKSIKMVEDAPGLAGP
jgi:hypothetical protein